MNLAKIYLRGARVALEAAEMWEARANEDPNDPNQGWRLAQAKRCRKDHAFFLRMARCWQEPKRQERAA